MIECLFLASYASVFNVDDLHTHHFTVLSLLLLLRESEVEDILLSLRYNHLHTGHALLGLYRALQKETDVASNRPA